LINEERDSATYGFYDDKMPPRERRLQVLGPKGFRVEKTGKGVRVTIIDRDHEDIETSGTSALSYHVHWAETVEMTSAQGIENGFKRSTLLAPTIPAPGRADAEATAEFTDAKFATGYFYVTGVDKDGRRSDPSYPVRVGSGTGGSVPEDVRHFQVSESGEVHNGTTLSAVSYSFQYERTRNLPDRVQFWFENYPNLNELSAGESVQQIAGSGGTQTGKLLLPVARRTGAGTIGILGTAVSGVGTNFRTIAAAGDYLEAFGVRALISSVDSATTLTLSGAWSGPSVAAHGDWVIIGSVTMYAVSIGQNGERRDDVTGAPSATVVLDGELSAPNAPTFTATPLGNAIRIEVTPSYGTELARVLVYRGTGSGVAFASCTPIHTFEADHSNSTGTLQWDDTDFTVYQREQGQTFSYFVQAVNVRDQPSAASSRVEASCRLDTGTDTGPQDNGRQVAKNLLYNAMFSGTASGSVDPTDTAQDDRMGFVPPAGFTYWDGDVSGSGQAPGHQSATEVILAMTAMNDTGGSWVFQEIDAWDHATPGHIPKGKLLNFQVKVRTSGGAPNGTFYLDILQYNGASHVSEGRLRERLSDDEYTTVDGAGGTTQGDDFLAVAGSDIVTDYQLVHGTFYLDPAVTTTKIMPRIIYSVTSWNGVNVIITEPMLSIAETPPYWTADMVDPDITYGPPSGGAPIPPGHFVDGDATWLPRIDLP
jgi:hypothetical protein